MTVEEIKAMVRRLVEARNSHDVEASVSFFPAERQEYVRQAFNKVTEAFPDVQTALEELIAEGDKVVLRWSFQGIHLGLYRAIPATGNRVNYTGIDIYKIVDGQIVSLVRETDNLAVRQQLGVSDTSSRQATL